MIFGDKCKEVGNFWGDKMPMMAMEEAGEFIQAVSKMERGKANAEQNLKEEIRDMYISLRAIMHHYDIDMNEIVHMCNEKLNTEKES